MICGASGFAHRADQLQAVFARRPNDERVETVLLFENARYRGGATRKRGVTPLRCVASSVGVPSLVRPEEVSQPQVHKPYRASWPASSTITRKPWRDHVEVCEAVKV